MIWLIIALIVAYLIIVALSIRTKIKTSGMTKEFIVSKCLWGIVILIAIVYSLSIVLPLLWAISTSLKDSVDFATNEFGLPEEWHFENFRIVLSKLKIREGRYEYDAADMLMNSFSYSVIGSFVGVFWVTLVAYIMGRFKFFGNNLLYNVGVLIMLIPVVGSLASSMIIKKRWGLYDNMYLDIMLPPATAFSGIYFMMLHGVFKGIPQTYSEAAYMDGANEWVVMFKIIIPMALPTCATIYILSFISHWNTYESFLIWYPSTPNLAYGMFKFQTLATSGASAATVPQIMAGFFIVMIPTLILYLLSQKLLKSNFMVGGIKG